MTGKIFRSILTIAGCVLLCALVIVMAVFYGYADNVQTTQLRDELSIAAAGTEQGGLAYLQSLQPEDFRITWVNPDGKVLFDTSTDSGEMGSHLQREEIWEALHYGMGSAVRRSDTVLERQIYEAKRLTDGSVLRISVGQKTIWVLAAGMLYPACLVAALAMILSAVLARHTAKKIVEPLEKLDLEHPLENNTYPELSPLLRRIHRQHEQIQGQLEATRRKNDEFDQITASMEEGLVLLDDQQKVLSINPAARKIFAAPDTRPGIPFCQVDRQPEMSEGVETALRDGNWERREERGGRTYQFLMNRIVSGDVTLGVMILALDVTDAENGEKNRREFTANVSHELKTPLQTIIGSAELLENGLVKPEDTKRFLGNIRKEASRMVLLVEDVIRLSHLDEGVRMPEEDVDLLEIAEQAARSVAIPAEEKHVSVRVTGEACVMHGVRSLLYEIAENLCSNAVKYNVEGGSVEVSVRREGDSRVLTVADTGIGIPQEDQSRVFERFYRVDKSHSRASGGTGLGLSIVKHAVQYHGGKVTLTSIPGRGTTVTVTL